MDQPPAQRVPAAPQPPRWVRQSEGVIGQRRQLGPNLPSATHHSCSCWCVQPGHRGSRPTCTLTLFSRELPNSTFTMFRPHHFNLYYIAIFYFTATSPLAVFHCTVRCPRMFRGKDEIRFMPEDANHQHCLQHSDPSHPLRTTGEQAGSS